MSIGETSAAMDCISTKNFHLTRPSPLSTIGNHGFARSPDR